MVRRLRLLVILLLAAILALPAPAVLSAQSRSVDARLDVNPLRIDLAISTIQATVGQRVQVAASVTNLGPSRVSNIVVELRVATGGLRIQGSTVLSISRLQPGQETSVGWAVCGQSPGNYVLMARATVNDAAIDSPARLLTVIAGRQRGCK